MTDKNSILEPQKEITSLLSEQYTDISLLCGYNYCNLYKACKWGKWHILKTLKPEFKSNPIYTTLFRKEFEISYPLNHPNIVQVYGFEEIPHIGTSIVMEYIDGLCLNDYLRQNQHTRQSIFKITDEICRALEYLHQQEITHKDLKPANILITRNGSNVKLIDFGLSDQDSYAIFKQNIGTLPYAAPEQRAGQAPTDNRADIYSLGVLLENINRMTGKTFIPAAVIRKCKSSETSKRFASIAELRSALKPKAYPFRTLILILLLPLIVIVYTLYRSNRLEDKISINREATQNTILQVKEEAKHEMELTLKQDELAIQALQDSLFVHAQHLVIAGLDSLLQEILKTKDVKYAFKIYQTELDYIPFSKNIQTKIAPELEATLSQIPNPETCKTVLNNILVRTYREWMQKNSTLISKHLQK